METMKTAMRACVVAFTGMTMMAAALAAPTVNNSDLLLQSDVLSRHESTFLQSVYAAGNQHFQHGEFVAALKQYDYAAWHSADIAQDGITAP